MSETSDLMERLSLESENTSGTSRITVDDATVQKTVTQEAVCATEFVTEEVESASALAGISMSKTATLIALPATTKRIISETSVAVQQSTTESPESALLQLPLLSSTPLARPQTSERLPCDFSEIIEEVTELPATPPLIPLKRPNTYHLIKYVTKSGRLFFVEKAETWRRFYAGQTNSDEQLSAKELAQYFTQEILPNIFALKLNGEDLRCMKALNLHPEYERVDMGYKRVSAEKRVASEREGKVGIHHRVLPRGFDIEKLFVPGKRKLTEKFVLDLESPQKNHHTVVVQQPFKKPRLKYGYQFSAKNAAVLSAALSYDYELASFQLLNPAELHKRLRVAKVQFEDHTRKVDNCKSAEHLCQKLQKIKDMREALVDIIDKQLNYRY